MNKKNWRQKDEPPLEIQQIKSHYHPARKSTDSLGCVHGLLSGKRKALDGLRCLGYPGLSIFGRLLYLSEVIGTDDQI